MLKFNNVKSNIYENFIEPHGNNFSHKSVYRFEKNKKMTANKVINSEAHKKTEDVKEIFVLLFSTDLPHVYN